MLGLNRSRCKSFTYCQQPKSNLDDINENLASSLKSSSLKSSFHNFKLDNTDNNSSDYISVNYSSDENNKNDMFVVGKFSSDDLSDQDDNHRERNGSLTDLGQCLNYAQQVDNVNEYIKLYKQYKQEWRQASNKDDFIPPNFYVSKVIYDPGCNRIELKINNKIIRLADGQYDLSSSIE